LKRNNATTSHARGRASALRSKTSKPTSRGTARSFSHTLKALLLLPLTLLHDAGGLLGKLVLGETQDFLFTLLRNGLRSLLHLHLHLTSSRFLLRLHFLEREKVHQLLILLVPLHELLRIASVGVYFLLDQIVDTRRHIYAPDYLPNRLRSSSAMPPPAPRSWLSALGSW
jgi:hypothetical protein